MKKIVALAFLMSLVCAVPAKACDFCNMHDMPGLYGRYPMAREASGTSWQPQDTFPDMATWTLGDTMAMVHGFANLAYTKQGGARGGEKLFSTNMIMGMLEHPFGGGAVGMRAMATAEPFMGKTGYPLLLQTGETADGRKPLIDRQHPHDLFMELALTARYALGSDGSLFGYVGLPGEPAIGPPAFMHRLSGMDNPIAPISHHWMDSTHVTYGVTTLGVTWRAWKLEGSAFRGREPDENHADIESSRLDSYAGRLSYNPTKNWALQGSYADINSPEQLFPNTQIGRASASVMYGKTWSDGSSQTTASWGRNWQRTIDTLDAWLLESAFRVRDTHTFFARVERVEKDDLAPAVDLTLLTGVGRTLAKHPFRPDGRPSDPVVLNVFAVEELSAGYIYDFPRTSLMTWGVGASGTVNFVPVRLEPFYGKLPVGFLLFIRLKIGGRLDEPETSSQSTLNNL